MYLINSRSASHLLQTCRLLDEFWALQFDLNSLASLSPKQELEVCLTVSIPQTFVSVSSGQPKVFSENDMPKVPHANACTRLCHKGTAHFQRLNPTALNHPRVSDKCCAANESLTQSKSKYVKIILFSF